MNTDRVFTGFNNNEKEILLYRENSNEYIDLVINKIVNLNDFDLETLKQLKETLPVLRYMPCTFIKKLYNYDRNKLINSKTVLLGLKGTITDLKETKIQTGWYRYNIPIHDYHYEWNLNNNLLGLYIYNREIIIDKEYKFKIYKNINDGKDYVGFLGKSINICQIPMFKDGMEYVVFNNYTLFDIVKEPVLEKKKVYEYAHATEKTKLESEK